MSVCLKIFWPTLLAPPLHSGEVLHHMCDSGESNDLSICHTNNKICPSVCQPCRPSVCHTINSSKQKFANFWRSHGRCVMLGSLTGRLLGLPRRCPGDEARATNARTVEMRANPFWCAREPVWRLEHLYSNRDARDERANRRTEHGERSTYQIKRSQHIPVILYMKIEFWVV